MPPSPVQNQAPADFTQPERSTNIADAPKVVVAKQEPKPIDSSTPQNTSQHHNNPKPPEIVEVLPKFKGNRPSQPYYMTDEQRNEQSSYYANQPDQNSQGGPLGTGVTTKYDGNIDEKTINTDTQSGLVSKVNAATAVVANNNPAVVNSSVDESRADAGQPSVNVPNGVQPNPTLPTI